MYGKSRGMLHHMQRAICSITSAIDMRNYIILQRVVAHHWPSLDSIHYLHVVIANPRSQL